MIIVQFKKKPIIQRRTCSIELFYYSKILYDTKRAIIHILLMTFFVQLKLKSYDSKIVRNIRYDWELGFKALKNKNCKIYYEKKLHYNNKTRNVFWTNMSLIYFFLFIVFKNQIMQNNLKTKVHFKHWTFGSHFSIIWSFDFNKNYRFTKYLKNTSKPPLN